MRYIWNIIDIHNPKKRGGFSILSFQWLLYMMLILYVFRTGMRTGLRRCSGYQASTSLRPSWQARSRTLRVNTPFPSICWASITKSWTTRITRSLQRMVSSAFGLKVCFMWKVEEGFRDQAPLQTLKWVVVDSSVMFHINGLLNDRSAPCLYIVTGWGVMSCVCGMKYKCGSALVKNQCYEQAPSYYLRCLKATISPNKQE